MRRVLVIGSPGSGKSAFSQRLASRAGLPLIHLDEHFWLPNWTRRFDADGWTAALGAMIAEESWVLDGNYPRTLELRASRADFAIVLVAPRYVCFYRVIKRKLLRQRPDKGVLEPEPISRGFLQAIWNGPRNTKQEIETLRSMGRLEIVILKRSREVESFLASIEP